jgi:hypothetical protein
MSHARFNEDDTTAVSRKPEHVTQPGGRERPLLSGMLVVLGLVGGVAAATVGGAYATGPVAPQVSYADDACHSAEEPTPALPSIQEQFQDSFAPGVVEDPPFHVDDKIGGC